MKTWKQMEKDEEANHGLALFLGYVIVGVLVLMLIGWA